MIGLGLDVFASSIFLEELRSVNDCFFLWTLCGAFTLCVMPDLLVHCPILIQLYCSSSYFRCGITLRLGCASRKQATFMLLKQFNITSQTHKVRKDINVWTLLSPEEVSLAHPPTIPTSAVREWALLWHAQQPAGETCPFEYMCKMLRNPFQEPMTNEDFCFLFFHRFWDAGVVAPRRQERFASAGLSLAWKNRSTQPRKREPPPSDCSSLAFETWCTTLLPTFWLFRRNNKNEGLRQANSHSKRSERAFNYSLSVLVSKFQPVTHTPGSISRATWQLNVTPASSQSARKRDTFSPDQFSPITRKARLSTLCSRKSDEERPSHSDHDAPSLSQSGLFGQPYLHMSWVDHGLSF